MRAFLLSAAIGIALTSAAQADETASPPMHNSVCIRPTDIHHTKVVDSRTILFYMYGGKVWQNTLPSACPGLTMQEGFVYTVRANTLCSNLETIRLIQFGTVCPLGAFTPYEKPKAP